MTDLNSEFITSLYDDDFKKMIIQLLSETDLNDNERIHKLVEYLAQEKVE